MTNKEKILESIKRLDEREPSKWDLALICSIKKFLFPLIRSELGEAEENSSYEEAKKIFST